MRAYQIMAEDLEIVKRIYRTDLAVNQNKRVVCEQTLAVMGMQYERTIVGRDTDLTETETPMTLFLDQVSLAHQSSNEERIVHAAAAVEHVSGIATDFPDQMVGGLTVLASSHLAAHHYQESRRVFESALEFIRAKNLTPQPDMLFNYVSTLMKLREYEAVLALWHEHHAQIVSRPKVLFRFECLRCFCYLFLRRPDEALQAIPPNITQRPESEYQYFRFIYMIAPYLQDDLESALREARNFGDYFNRHRDQLIYPKEKAIVGMFRELFMVVGGTLDDAGRSAKLSGIRSKLQAFVEQSPEYRDYQYLLWLEDEIDRLGELTRWKP